MTMKDATSVETPELDRRSEIMHSEEHPHETLGAFYDWLHAHGLVIAKWLDGETRTRERRCPDCGGLGIDIASLNERQRQLRDARVGVDDLPGTTEPCSRCNGDGFVLEDYFVDDPQLVEDYRPPEQLLADYFDLDLVKISDEQMALLKAIQIPAPDTPAPKRCRGCNTPIEGSSAKCGACS